MAAQGIGARVQRKEDARHLHGRGNFVSDMVLPGQSEVAFLRSMVAHGRIRRIVKPAGAEKSVYVRADLDGASAILAPSTIPSYKPSEQHPLAHGKVRFVGEALAMCVAPTRAMAEDLAERIEVEIDELPPLVDVDAARAPDAVRVHEDWSDNLHMTLGADIGFAAESAGAEVVVTREFTLSRQAMVPMEGKAVVADWDSRLDQLVVYSSTQVPHMIRVGLAQMLGLESGQVRVIAPDVGGGFGYKAVLHPEELCVAWLARQYRRPFRYVEDRREHLIAGANSRQHHYRVTAHADRDGRLKAVDAEIVVDGGAYSAWPFTIGLEPGQATGNLPGPYDFRGYRCKTACVATNKPGFLPYRGVARTGVCFAMELTIDAVARAVGREPWEVRHDNLVPLSAMPYDNVTRKHFDSGDYRKSLLLAKEKIDFESWRSRQKQPEADGRLIGVGFATYCEQTAHGTSVFSAWGLPLIPGFDQATVRITPDGGLEVRVGVHSHGQGMETTLAQIAHEVLGIDLAKIRVVHGDTGITPYSTGTYASRSIVMAGGAVVDACKALVPRLVGIGAHLMQSALGTVRLEHGALVGPQRSASIREVAEAWYLRPERLPPDVDVNGLEATVGYRPKVDTGAFSYASHAAVVAVDTELGQIEILDYVIVEDCGTLVNPMVVDGQTLGGAAQGIGTALYEESPYDANGQPLASTFADYLLPGPTEIPAMRIHHMQTPSPYTAYGIKGMGEGGAIALPAALFNAVNDALRSLGAEVTETPLTPRRLLEALAPGGGAMKAAAFDLLQLPDLAQAIRALANDGAKLLAGGQSLGPMLNLRLARPKLLVDISDLDELQGIADRGDHWRIGGAVTHAALEDRAGQLAGAEMLCGVAGDIAYRAVRNRGTIGGSLAHADPAGDWPLALAALDARVEVQGANGTRVVSADGFVAGAFTTVLAKDEVVVAVAVTKLSMAARWGTYKFCRKTGEFPEASAAAVFDPESRFARAFLGALSGPPRAATELAMTVARQGASAVTRAAALAAVAAAAPDLDTVQRGIHATALHRALLQAVRP